jgi:hypothetical protein
VQDLVGADSPSSSTSQDRPSQVPSVSPPTAVSPPELELSWDALAHLRAAPRAPKTGYTRAAFGPAWSDDVDVAGGHDGCDQRNQTLLRDMAGVQLKPGTNGCVVLSGTLTDPYTGTVIAFQRGTKSVDIDHVVALGDAWQKGAQSWTPDRRRDFANDPLNLLAVSSSANRAKGDRDAATWLPRSRQFRCDYARRQIAVKAKYQLWATPAELDAFKRLLGQCSPASSGGQE